MMNFKIEKLELTIKKERFLDWYFNYGQDQENKDLRIDLANSILDHFADVGKMVKLGSGSEREIFDKCNQDAIRVYFTCQYDMMTDDFDIELSDLNKKYSITLKK